MKDDSIQKQATDTSLQCSGSVLAQEYGYLDHKHDMGYEPRPRGFEEAYRCGWDEWSKLPARKRNFVTSYADSANWGWH